MPKKTTNHYGLAPVGGQTSAPIAYITSDIDKEFQHIEKQSDEALARMAGKTKDTEFAIQARHYIHDVEVREYYEAAAYTSEVTAAAQDLIYAEEVESLNLHSLKLLKRDVATLVDDFTQELHREIRTPYKPLPQKKPGWFSRG